MDALPVKKDIQSYIRVAKHLVPLELSAPRILSVEEEKGFLLIEDFGNNTYTHLLNQGISEESLYEKAVDVFIRLHLHPRGIILSVPLCDLNTLLEETVLLPIGSGQRKDAINALLSYEKSI